MWRNDAIDGPGPLLGIIDDDDAARDSLKLLLEIQQFRVEAFETCQAFLVSEAIRQYQCLILDVHLPDMSGFDLLDILQDHDIHVPTIFVTGRPDKAIHERAAAMGALVLLEKPIDFDALMAALERAIAQHT